MTIFYILNPTQYLNITTLLFICWKCSTVRIIRLIWAFVLKSYRFETISQWVNNIRIVIFGRSFPLEDIQYLLRGACIVFPTVRHTILTTHENHPIWKPPMIWISFFLSFLFSFSFFFAITKNKTDLSLSVLNKALVVLENLLALCGWLHEEHQVWEQIRIDFSVNTTYLLF